MSRPDPYAARHGFFDPARGAGSPRRIIAGLLMIEVAWVVSGTILVPWPPEESGTAFRTLATHFVFLALAAATILVVQRLHGRDALALIGRTDRLAGDFLRVVRGLLIFLAVILLVPGTDWEGVGAARNLGGWIALLPFACLAVLVQTAAEELLYRGYLQQSLGALHDHPAVWMVLPSLLFGLSHYNPALPWDATFAHMIWTTAFGLAAADLTARTGSLGAATGLHFGYNLPLVVLFAPAGELSGLSLFSLPAEATGEPVTAARLGFDLFYLWMLWMVCRIAIRR